MRILIGACVRQDPTTLSAYLDALHAQRLPPDTHVEYAFIDDNLDAASSELLARSLATRVIPVDDPVGEYAVEERTHRWSIPAFYKLGRNKQRLLDLARDEGFDAVWLVDSDLLCAPDTLASLIATERPIVSAVFWTAWNAGDAPLPQVWMRHPYGFEGSGWSAAGFLRTLESRALVRVRGLGACTLISSAAIVRGAAFWPLVEGLPTDGMWQGEDRHFCIRAERLHLDLWADAWPEIYHIYRPSDRAFIPAVQAQLADTCKERAAFGDWVSFTLEPLSDPGLIGYKEHVRGQMGVLPVLPEIEEALYELTVGEARIVSVRFPEWWEIEHYRNESKVVRVRLLGARAPSKNASSA